MKKIESLKDITENIGALAFNTEYGYIFRIESVCVTKDEILINDVVSISDIIRLNWLMSEEDVKQLLMPIRDIHDYIERVELNNGYFLTVLDTVTGQVGRVFTCRQASSGVELLVDFGCEDNEDYDYWVFKDEGGDMWLPYANRFVVPDIATIKELINQLEVV